MLEEFIEMLEKMLIPYDIDRWVDNEEPEIVIDLLDGEPAYRVVFMLDEESGKFLPSGWGKPEVL